MASTEQSVDIDMPELIRHMTLTVRIRRQWLSRLRVQLALPLLWLAAKCAGVGFSVSVDSEP